MWIECSLSSPLAFLFVFIYKRRLCEVLFMLAELLSSRLSKSLKVVAVVVDEINFDQKTRFYISSVAFLFNEFIEPITERLSSHLQIDPIQLYLLLISDLQLRNSDEMF